MLLQFLNDYAVQLHDNRYEAAPFVMQALAERFQLGTYQHGDHITFTTQDGEQFDLTTATVH